MHTSTDKISFSVYLRSRADSIHYDNIMAAPPSLMQAFFTPPPFGFNGATLSQVQQGIQQMAMAGRVPAPETYDANNDVIYTNKFRLDMKALINNHMKFFDLCGCLVLLTFYNLMKSKSVGWVARLVCRVSQLACLPMC